MTATHRNLLSHAVAVCVTHCNRALKHKAAMPGLYYRVAKTHRIPNLYRSFLAKVTYI